MTKDLSKVNTLRVNEQLQKEIIDIRQNLAKFVNGFEILKNMLKYNKHPYDKTSLGYDKKKEIKKNKSTSHCLNCKKLDTLSKPSKTNKKGPNIIWVPKNMIILVAYLIDSKKKTLIMVPK
ncbi:hypothetical protein CR513_57484, partial [Mucuna pruriens]